MDWKREASQNLIHYRERKAAVESLQEKIAQIESEMTSLGSAGGGEHVRSSCSDPGDRMINLIVSKDYHTMALERTLANVADVEKGLACLSEEDRKVLDLFYITPKKIDVICDELGAEKSTAYRWRNSALKSFTISRYGACETD